MSMYGFHAFVLSELQSTELSQFCFHINWIRYPFFMPRLCCCVHHHLYFKCNLIILFTSSKLHGGLSSSFPVKFLNSILCTLFLSFFKAVPLRHPSPSPSDSTFSYLGGRDMGEGPMVSCLWAPASLPILLGFFLWCLMEKYLDFKRNVSDF